MSVGEDKPTKWVQREGQIRLSIKKNWFMQEPLAEKTFTWIRKYFQQREFSAKKFCFSIFAAVFANERNGIFLTRVGERRRRIQGHPWISQILTPPYQRVPGFQIVGKAQRHMSRTKNQRGLYYFIYLYLFHSFAVRLRDSPCVSPFRFRFLFFCIRSPEAWQLLSWRPRSQGSLLPWKGGS